VDSDNLFKGDRSQRKRISFLKIFRGCERKFRNILEGFDVLGSHSRLIKSFSIKFGILIDMVHCPLKPFRLNPLELPLRPNLWHEASSHKLPPVIIL
jgi:hypothetical protein